MRDIMYVDVRGVWPVLIVGKCAYRLVGAPRNITVDEAFVILYG